MRGHQEMETLDPEITSESRWPGATTLALRPTNTWSVEARGDPANHHAIPNKLE